MAGLHPFFTHLSGSSIEKFRKLLISLHLALARWDAVVVYYYGHFPKLDIDNRASTRGNASKAGSTSPDCGAKAANGHLLQRLRTRNARVRRFHPGVSPIRGYNSRECDH